LECLEDRTVPATFAVTTTLDLVDPADGRLSLREAVAEANTLAGADVIILPAGVYKITRAGPGEDGNLTGDLDVLDSVRFRGAGAGVSIVDAQDLDRVFDVSGTAPSSIDVVLRGLTIRNGDVTGHGGGVRVGNADLVVRDSAVIGNRATGFGGGISNGTLPGSGDVTVIRTAVVRNAADNGGGLAVFGPGSALTIRHGTIRRNIADGSAGGLAAQTAAIANSTISGNVAGGSGGGITASAVALTNSTVNGNVAGGSGGGIFATTATLTNSTLAGNTTGADGGGIHSTSSATLTGSTVSGNAAGSEGGGVRATAATLLNVTVAENIASNGGGLFHVVAIPGGAFAVKNSIIALNGVGITGTGPDASGSFISLGHNLVGDGTGATGSGGADDRVGTAENPIDPKLGPLAFNGGRTKTHALLAGSPAIDRGDNAGAPSTDQRGPGFPRRKDGNGDGRAVVDIGAFER
jgi:predicted outer membrane repeat protein